MNALQVCRQLQYLLSKKTWSPDGSEFVFASVIVSAGATEEAASVLRTPLALICPTDAEADDQAPDFDIQTIRVSLSVQCAGDTLGQGALIGANRSGAGTQGQGSSVGRGLLEIEEQLLSIVKFVDQTSGVRLCVARKGSIEAAFDPNTGYVAHREYLLRARTSVSRSYDGPLSFRGTNATGGNASLAWKNPPLRFDWDELTRDNNQQVALGAALVLRRIAGSTPPKFPHQAGGPTGTVIQTWTDFDALPVSLTDNPGAGTWSYALAGGFDETGSGSVERWSDVPATISGLVVT